MEKIKGNSQESITCTTCNKTPTGFFERYQGFLLSPGTLITFANVLLLLMGFVTGLLGQPQAADYLYLASAIIGGAPIFILAAGNILRDFDLTAGVMVSIAMIAALIVGEYEAAAIVALMMLVGEMLEDFTVARADNALNELANLVPATVTLRQDSEDVEVPIEMVRRGDLVLVRPGGRIPIDGRILKGTAAVDQSSITGESIPLDKGPGDGVYAGTLCHAGALEILVENIGQETTLGNMISLVKQAQETQAPVQRVANKYAQYMAPLAIIIAIVTYFLTKDIIRSITVLIVICPCSLVLATPTAVVAAIGNAAKRGVLVKHGIAMEQIGKVDIVAFDKTGTLTLGEPRLKKTISLNGMGEQNILALSASAERSSEHPLGKAVVAAALDANLDVVLPEDFEALPGHGIRAVVQGRDVLIGVRMLRQHGIILVETTKAKMRDLEAGGNTVIPIAVDQEVAGLLVFSDTVRPESKNAIQSLKQLGIKEIVLISGDNPQVAEAVGKELTVDRILSQVLPEQKLEFIRRLQAKELKVAYVGDGVNDAPALAAADVGVAMGTVGTAIAMETADIVLLTDKIERLPYLIDLSRSGLDVIRNNVIFSMSMNVLAVALSVFGIIGPVVGAVMHEVSALPVVANSARLIGRKARFLAE
ncbi:MAG: cation-translocating P-type ATPase [Anaerolineales bacterium]